jgi:hypothetical protein
MTDTKLVHLLKTLSRSELGRWRDFVRSPYYNKNQHVLALAQFLEKRAPDFNSKSTTKEKAFAVIFSNEPYNDLRIRHLISILLKVTEEFLAAQSTRHNKMDKNIQLLHAYQKRNLSRHFESGSRQADELQHEAQDAFYHYHLFRIELQREMYLDQKEGRRKETGLQKVSDHLDAFYLVNKLKQCCAIISHRITPGCSRSLIRRMKATSQP